MNRKANLEGNTLVNKILISLVAILIISIATMILTDLFEVQEDIICRESIRMASAGNIASIGKKLDFKCPRQEVVIEKDDVESGGEVKRELIKREVADYMKSCNYMTGEGKLDPYEKEDMSTSVVCLICYNIEFDEDLQEEKLMGINMVDFLEGARIDDSELTTYATYLKNGEKPEYYKNTGKSDISLVAELDVTKKYHVIQMLIHGNKHEWLKSFIPFMEEKESYSMIALIEEKDITKVGCTRLAN